MKRFFILLCLINIFIFPSQMHAETSIDVTKSYGIEMSSFYQPKGSIVADNHTGRILWEENIDRKWPLASMSKLMTLTFVLDKIKEGTLPLDKKITVTVDDEVFSQHPLLSNNKMQKGAVYSVEELIYLTIVPSSNVATRMLMQQVEPDMRQFVKGMNQRAKDLGMRNTYFTNPFGAENAIVGKQYLPTGFALNEDNISTSRDFAKLAYYMMNTYPNITKYTKHATYVSKPNTELEEQFHTYLHSLKRDVHEYPGTDGLKTGSSGHAAYNYTATVQKGGFRIVQVLLGVGHWDVDDSEYKRHVIGNALLDRVYERYQYKEVLSKGMHYINGRWYKVEQPLKDVVEKDKPVRFEILNNKITVLDPDRHYLTSDMKPPSVVVTPLTNYKTFIISGAFTLFMMICILILLSLIRKHRHKYMS